MNHNNFSYGRERPRKAEPVLKKTPNSAYKFFAASVIICLIFGICITNKNPVPYENILKKEEKAASNYLSSNEYVAAMLGLDDHAAAKKEQLEDSRMTVIEPFGYFNGEWNLWEYIGDSLSSLLFGS